MESYEQIVCYKGLFAMEIYNTGAEKEGICEYNSQLYDLLLRNGKNLRCVAADDNHNYHPMDDPRSDSFGGFVMINADKLDHNSVISALENGDFYSSTGPLINELYMENGYVCVNCSEAKKIRFITNNRYGKVITASNEPLCYADFKIDETTKWFRIEITDTCGETAYTNAYFI
jgi:hypothetical protein